MRIRDLKIDYLEGVKPFVSLEQAWDQMVTAQVSTLPVTDDEGMLTGIVTMGDISKAYVHDIEDIDLDSIRMPLGNILHALTGTSMTHPGKVVALKDVVFIRREGTPVPKDAVVVQSLYPEETIRRIIVRSFPVDTIMTKDNLMVLHLEDEAEEMMGQVEQSHYRCFPVLDETEKVVGVIPKEELFYHRHVRQEPDPDITYIRQEDIKETLLNADGLYDEMVG